MQEREFPGHMTEPSEARQRPAALAVQSPDDFVEAVGDACPRSAAILNDNGFETAATIIVTIAPIRIRVLSFTLTSFN